MTIRALMYSRLRASCAEGDLDLDLDRTTPRQRGHPDRGSTVSARGTEHLGEQLARAVDDRGLLHEPWRRRDESEHRQHAFDAIEAPELGAQDRQRVQRA